MAQFNNLRFSFDGIRGEEFGLYLVNTGEEGKIFGLQRSVGMTEVSYARYSLESVQTSNPVFKLRLFKASPKLEPEPFTEEELDRINTWLFSSQEFKPLICTDNPDVVYYGMFVAGNLWHNSRGEGYIDLDFQLCTPHAFGAVQKIIKFVNGAETFEITCNDNVNGYCLPDVEFHLDEGQTSLTIKNNTTNQQMSFFDLNNECKDVYVFNDGIQFAKSLNNAEINMRQKSNNDFLKLIYGNNKITITGHGVVIIYVQPRIVIR